MSALRAAFDEERAWLRDCDDQRAVLDRMAGYRDNMTLARRVGNAQGHAFAEHLVELAEDRLAALKVGATRVKERPPARPTRVEPPPPPPEPPAQPTSAPPRVDDSAVVRQLQEALAASQEAERRAARERDAAERRAREASAEGGSFVASQRRAQGGGSAAPTAPSGRPPVRDGGRLSPPATLPSAPSSARPTSARPTSAPRPPTATGPAPRSPAATTASPPASRAARPEVSPPTAAPKSSPPPSPTAPASPALTGADLAAFRRGAGLTQVAAAQRLGVTQGTISKAEGNPRSVLGPGLQEALRLATG